MNILRKRRNELTDEFSYGWLRFVQDCCAYTLKACAGKGPITGVLRQFERKFNRGGDQKAPIYVEGYISSGASKRKYRTVGALSRTVPVASRTRGFRDKTECV